jgi:CubicO group peptidase (beta-lactamase class C family)
MDSLPGAKFNYNSACSELVKEIISRSSGITFKEFVVSNLFNRMNISPYYWDTYPENNEPAWGGLSLTTSDMAKIGILMLKKGWWANTQVVSEKWVELSMMPISSNDSISYGLHWWVTKQPDGKPLVFAAGYGDQYVYIAPDKRLVVAINGKNFTDHKWERNNKDLIERILKAYVY